jgi:hypothetical protein
MTDIVSPGHAALDSRLALYPLTYVNEGDQIIIGRSDVDSFAVFSADAAGLVRRLATGEDLAAAGAWYLAAHGEPADLGDLVAVLRELDFVIPAGPPVPRPAGASQPPLAGGPVRWQRLGRAALSPVALSGYAAGVAVAVYLMMTTPALRPGPSTVFFSRSLLVVLGVTLGAQAVGVTWHEAFHVLAGRRIGLPSRLSVGRRLYFVVIQTTLTGLMGLPARRRILPFCAGLIADAVAVSVLIGLADAGRLAGWPSWLGRTAVGLAYLTILRMLWQAMFFMETDLCHVLASLLRCPDLHKMTREYLRNRYARLRERALGRPPLGPAIDESGWSARDTKIARRYAPFVLLGSALLIGSAVFTSVPVLAGLAIRVYRGVVSGDLLTARFWDSAVAGGVMVAQFAVVAVIKIHDRRLRQQTAVRSAIPGA